MNTILRDSENPYSPESRAFEALESIGLLCADARQIDFKHEDVSLFIFRGGLPHERHLHHREKRLFKEAAKALLPENANGQYIKMKYRNRSLQEIFC